MPSSTNSAAVQQQNIELRIALSAAYAAIEGQKAVQSFSAITFEDLAAQQLQSINGPDTTTRPNQLNAVAAIVANVVNAAQQIQALPDTAFVDPSALSDVNSPV